MRKKVAWRRHLGDPKIPGGDTFMPPEMVPARIVEKRVRVDDDKTAERVIWIPVRFDVRPGDHLDDAEVITVKTPEDAASAGIVRFCLV